MADRKPATFPPPTIAKWVNFGAVSTEMLVEELRYWADAFEALQGAYTEVQHHPARIDGDRP